MDAPLIEHSLDGAGKRRRFRGERMHAPPFQSPPRTAADRFGQRRPLVRSCRNDRRHIWRPTDQVGNQRDLMCPPICNPSKDEAPIRVYLPSEASSSCCLSCISLISALNP